MAREDEKVAIEGLHIDREVGHALGTVHKEMGPAGMGHGGHFAHGIDRTEHVAHMGTAYQPRALVQQVAVSLQVEFARIVHRHHAQPDALALAEQLPGHDVAVVLHHSEHHLVALAEEGFAVGKGHQVETLRGAAGEDDFGRRTGIEEAAHPLAGGFVEVGGLLGEEMHAAVNVGIDRIVFVGNGLDHAAGFLRGGGIV